MNIIFLTLTRVSSIAFRGIYTDLMRKFRDEGHQVYMVVSSERRFDEQCGLLEIDGVKVLRVKIPNVQKTNVVEKGIGTLMMEPLYKRAIKKYFKDVPFGLILYSTPPITFNNVVRYLKKKNPQAVAYLLLKDIFPQNAVDMKMFSKNSPFYWLFRRKEKQLYQVSDFIGCMSPANMEFIKKHNDFVNPEIVELAPNSLEVVERKPVDKLAVRKRLGLPADKKLFVYGGNLGVPQGIPFMIKCLDACAKFIDCHFIIVGGGTEKKKIDEWLAHGAPSNVQFMERLPKNDYDDMVSACDVGMIFLDHRFTIPNYPSRLIPYLDFSLPVLVCSDPNTDVGKIAQDNGYGLWCESNNVQGFVGCVEKLAGMDQAGLNEMGKRGRRFYEENYDVKVTYKAIAKHLGH